MPSPTAYLYSPLVFVERMIYRFHGPLSLCLVSLAFSPPSPSLRDVDASLRVALGHNFCMYVWICAHVSWRMEGRLTLILVLNPTQNPNPLLPVGQSEPLTKFHDGHLVESETYIGGHVECLEVTSYLHAASKPLFPFGSRVQECLELCVLAGY